MENVDMVADNPTAPDQEKVSAGATGGDTAGLVPQDRVNRLEAKWRREAEARDAKIAEYERQLAELAEAKKTETERAIDRAREETAKQVSDEWSRKLKEYQIDSELRLALQAKGYDTDLAVLVRSKAKIENPEDVKDAIDSVLGAKPWARAHAPTVQSGAPTGTSGARVPKTLADLQEFVAQYGHAAVTDEIWRGIEKGAWGAGSR